MYVNIYIYTQYPDLHICIISIYREYINARPREYRCENLAHLRNDCTIVRESVRRKEKFFPKSPPCCVYSRLCVCVSDAFRI